MLNEDCCIPAAFKTLVSSLGFPKRMLISFVIGVGDLSTIPRQFRKPSPRGCLAQGDLTGHLAGESGILLLSSY